jgi:methyl-accepting chemotaxis protein
VARWQIGVLAAVVLVAGCGGDSGSSASEEYANDVCSNLSTWVTSVDGAAKSLGDAGLSIDGDDVQTAVSDVSAATDTVVDDLKQLGPPQTDAGTQAKSELDSLGNTLAQQVDTVEQALNGGGSAIDLAATVTTALSTAADAVESTYQSLRGLDPGGELQDGFENAEDCKSLSDQLEAIGS